MLPRVAIATGGEGTCGEYIFQVKILNGLGLDERQFELYYKKKGKKKKLFYKTHFVVYLNAACIKNREKQDVMLFLVSHGGTVGPEDKYGIFDPCASKMLLNPSDWPKGNSYQAQKLLGYPPPHTVGDGKTFFCCDEQEYSAGAGQAHIITKIGTNYPNHAR